MTGPTRAGVGIAVSASAGLASLCATFVLFPLVVRFIGAAPYGLWILLTTLAAYLYYADLGIGTSIVHFGARHRGGDFSLSPSELLSNGLVWMLLAAAVVTPAYVLVGFFYGIGKGLESGVGPREAQFLLCLGGVLVLGIVMRPYQSILTGAGLIKDERVNQVVGVAFRCIAVPLACISVGTIAAVAVAEVLALLIPPALSIWSVSKHGIANFDRNLVSKAKLRAMLSYSCKSAAMDATGALTMQAGVLMAGVLGGPTSVTLVSAAQRVYTGLLQVLGWVSSPVRAQLSRLYVRGGDLARTAVQDLFIACVSMSFVLCASFVIGTREFVVAWLGSNLDTDIVVMLVRLYVLGLFFYSIWVPLITAGDALGRPGLFFKLQASWLAILVIVGFALFPQLGIASIGWGLTGSLVLLSPPMLLVADRALQIDIAALVGRTALVLSAFSCSGLTAALFALFLADVMEVDSVYRAPVILMGAWAGVLSVIGILWRGSTIRRLRSALAQEI